MQQSCFFNYFTYLCFCQQNNRRPGVKEVTWHHIIAVLLLLIFVTGQVVGYTHTHHEEKTSLSHRSSQKQQGDDIKCPICQQAANPLFLFHFDYTVRPLLPVVQYEYALFVPADEIVRVLISGNRGPPIC